MKTNSVYFAMADAEGRFRLENLAPGRYRIQVSSLNHQTLKISDFYVGPRSKIQRDFFLQPIYLLEPREVQEPESKPESSIKNFFRVNEHICTGGQPTMEELDKLKADGVKAVINLRMPSEFNAEEEAAKMKELGLRYFHIPFTTEEPKDEPVEQFLKVMADKENLPVFIHCTVANRVGAFWMIRRVLVDNWPLKAAEEEAKKVGLRNPKTREFALDYIKRHQKK